MARLNRSQKQRKRRRRRREREKRWLARGKEAGVYLVTSFRRFDKLYGSNGLVSRSSEITIDLFRKLKGKVFLERLDEAKESVAVEDVEYFNTRICESLGVPKEMVIGYGNPNVATAKAMQKMREK